MRDEVYDVVVAGGGSAGVAAAVGAARTGAKVLLVEAAGCLGGAATMRNVVTYCGVHTLADPSRQVVFGVAESVLKKLRKWGAVTPPQRFRGVFLAFDPEAAKVAMDEVCDEAGVHVLLHSQLIGAQRDVDRVASLTLQDHGGRHAVEARSFIDATGEGNLAHLSGASLRYGNCDEVNLGSLGTRFGGIPADVTVTADQIAAAVQSQLKAGAGPFAKDRSVVVRLPISGDLALYVASADYDPRDAVSLSKAEASGRQQARAYLQAIQTIDGCEGTYLVSTGPQFGTRESRHLNCTYQLTWQDIAERRTFDDCIALGAWGAEWHDRKTYVSTFDYSPDREAYQIPLGCLVSQDTANLFAAGRTVDGDRKAGAAIRVMGTSFATGHAAGVAAAEVADHGRFAAHSVRQTLLSQGAMINLSNEI